VNLGWSENTGSIDLAAEFTAAANYIDKDFCA
jgi:hypothetical protein